KVLSPLTEADKISHQVIVNGLKTLTPDIPILSEEDSDIAFEIRSKWKKYWLIDPLDGTKEFIKRNGQFTVNIALIINNYPKVGIINVPINKKIYWGSKETGSFYFNGKENIKINVSKNKSKKLRILASLSHKSEKLESFLKMINDFELINKGSSLKFCLIASNFADIYPRFNPTSEWDIAAGHAILEGAGGSIFNLSGSAIEYNKRDYLNPSFIALNSDHINEEINKILEGIK
ncbi:MAG: 3'(2'),5'-bisphosphate nucleotidase CysQ, partial [Gammaproteobacteria bacterium]|nr:3'(2'),5'-bisphosphate nucleotidase CysQ [Gammaproteobacteria bacterium]